MAHYGSGVYAVDELLSVEHSDSPEKQLNHFSGCFPQFIDEVAVGKDKEWTPDDKVNSLYGQYLYTRLNHIHRENGGLDKRGRNNILKTINDGIKLYHDLKDIGLKVPPEMYYKGDKRLVLARGRRRLTILKKLGYETVPVRRFSCRETFLKYSFNPSWCPGDNAFTIHGFAGLQFAKLQKHATDKYWVHGYTPYYDRHIGPLRNKKNLKILEIGISRGASLLLWRVAFPKAQIFGVDKDNDAGQLIKGKDRINIMIGNESDEGFMKMVAQNGPYDIVIDDGSHRCEHQQMVFRALWPITKSVYVIEDLRGGSYLNKWKRPKGVPKTIDMIKKLIDATHRKAEIRGISNYYNICFMEKL